MFQEAICLLCIISKAKRLKVWATSCLCCLFVICQTSDWCFGTLAFCAPLFFKSKLDSCQNSGWMSTFHISEKYKKGNTFNIFLWLCPCVHIDALFYFFLQLIDISFFLWWERERVPAGKSFKHCLVFVSFCFCFQ